MFERQIVYFGKPYIVACDGKCNKAWGINTRPRVQLSENDDDIAWLSDSELGEAPENPGTYEGNYGKPLFIASGEDLNKWCVRECERSQLYDIGEEIILKSFNDRLYNIER